jgi:hypothetical protein
MNFFGDAVGTSRSGTLAASPVYSIILVCQVKIRGQWGAPTMKASEAGHSLGYFLMTTVRPLKLDGLSEKA